jgi:hypothetical protein
VGRGEVWSGGTDNTSFGRHRGLKAAELQTFGVPGSKSQSEKRMKIFTQSIQRNRLVQFQGGANDRHDNFFTQHSEVGTTIAKKFTASLKALQLEIGCIGNPLLENYDELGLLATACWAKSFWKQLHFYHFAIHMEYAPLQLPQQNDALIVTIPAHWLHRE